MRSPKDREWHMVYARAYRMLAEKESEVAAQGQEVTAA
jgi:hypothetical protein